MKKRNKKKPLVRRSREGLPSVRLKKSGKTKPVNFRGSRVV